ncbi:DUF2313 domain-containing protein, partial [Histophilus somni]
FDRLQDSAEQIANVINPITSGQMLIDWERVLGITNVDKPYQQRVLTVIAKINEIGGLSIPYFTQLAQFAGYHIKIVEPQPF